MKEFTWFDLSEQIYVHGARGMIFIDVCVPSTMSVKLCSKLLGHVYPCSSIGRHIMMVVNLSSQSGLS